MADIEIIDDAEIEEDDDLFQDVYVDEYGNEMVLGGTEDMDEEATETVSGEATEESLDEGAEGEAPQDSSVDADMDPLTETIEE